MTAATATEMRPGLIDFLRAETREAHRRLEARLDLLRPPPSRDRFLRLVTRFHGFHAVWEPAVAPWCPIREGHSRLPHIGRDLRALGLDDAAIASISPCEPAATLALTQEGAVGSCYVVEGSTLGGQVIGRMLAGAPWVPAGGLATFTPYGPETGARWRAFGAWCEAQADGLDRSAVAVSARATFAMLEDWLSR